MSGPPCALPPTRRGSAPRLNGLPLAFPGVNATTVTFRATLRALWVLRARGRATKTVGLLIPGGRMALPLRSPRANAK